MNLHYYSLQRHFLLVALIMTGLSLGGCFPIILGGAIGGSTIIAANTVKQERGISGIISDAKLKSKVAGRIREINPANHDKIDIVAHQARIILLGVLENEKMQIDAVRGAWEVPGVAQVIDETQIGPALDLNMQLKDSWITSQAKSKILFNKDISYVNYEIHTINGIIYLIGFAYTHKELNTIVDIISHIEGVKKVISHIIVKES